MLAELDVRFNVGPGPTGGAVVLRVHQQVISHLISGLRREVTVRALQQEHTWRRQSVQRKNFFFGARYVMMDHVCSVGSGAAAAVRTQQTVDVSRVVSREIRGVGSTLQTHQPVSVIRGTPVDSAVGRSLGW